MNIKKSVALIAALFLVLGCFASCSLNPQEKESETETTTETTTAAPDYDSWAMAYEEYIFTIFAGEEKLVGYEYEIEECRFKIIDLDLNGVPELLISEGEYDSSKVNIYSYDGYEVQLLGTAGNKGNILYSESTGVIGAYELLEDGEFYQETHYAYSIDGRKLITDWQGVTRTQNGELVPVDYSQSYGDEVTYMSNEEETTAESYATLCARYVPDDLIEIGRDGFELTQDNVIAVIEKGEEDVTETEAVTEYVYESHITLTDKEKEIYNEVLRAFEDSENYGENSKFMFAYIDDNDVPELIISTGDDHGTGAIIYTISNDVAVQVCVAGQNGVAAYEEKGGIIVGTYESNGIVSTTVYKLSNGEITTEWEGVYISAESEGGKEEYSSNGEIVEKAEYLSKYDTYVKNTLVYNTTDGKLGGTPDGYALNDGVLDAVFTGEEETTTAAAIN